ncbi:DUF5805 domain-containing protein [Haloglomus litoreum]|uniref:DUF5805 domain-containing protein n=1 Tax=Haloglomus litoreum TaxID=3034026 RepID=UPI0023E81BF9|nr:DUF5805 domain-containing protein [Haloglomus sp. DT116]
MSTDGSETERVSVSTYIPAYQRATWAAEAESMGVSRSEYVRLMVQAGRRSFDLDGTAGNSPQDTETGQSGSPGERVTEHNPEEGHEPGSDPGGDGLEERVLAALDSDDYLGWDELVDELTGGLEDRLEETLDDLLTSGRVKHSGRHGGYTVVADE